MNTFTVIAFVLPASAHHLESIEAIDATDAVIRVREKLLLDQDAFEVVAVIRGAVHFELMDATAVVLAAHCPTCG